MDFIEIAGSEMAKRGLEDMLIEIAGSEMAKRGLEDMLEAAEDGMSGRIQGGRLTDVATALLLIEIAKRADDRDEWFPFGKWATIQAIQGRCDDELKTLFSNAQGHTLARSEAERQ